MKTKMTYDDATNLWLNKYYGITVKDVMEQHPDWTFKEFYPAYPVTQKEHDEWYEEIINLLYKSTRLSKKYIKKSFAFDYLNCAPNIKEIDDKLES
jgi:hypothetical protein